MPGLISQDTIEQVRQANDIVEIIGEYIRLKKRGRNFLALCPFHTEKTPSFTVSQDKQMYYCFGCGKGGSIFTFLMEHESMTYTEAVRFLARKAGIIIQEKREAGTAKEEYEKLHYAHQIAIDYFRSLLHSDRYQPLVMPYLKETRWLTDESIHFFQLGIAGDDWDGLLNHAIRKDLFPADLEKAGLVSKSEKGDKYFDRFRQRLMIPIFNLSSKPIAFGGRALKKGELSKYINSPETPLYSKSNILYGLNFSRQFIRESNEVIIVEGYFDFISLYQAGIKNVVASSGTAFTSQQARLLARFCDKAYLFFDADSAGQKAAVRSVDALFDAGMEVMVMIPPEGLDPDSTTIKEGAGGIEKIKLKAMPYIEYRTKDIDLRGGEIIAKEKMVKELAELAAKIGDNTRRQMFIDSAADRLQIKAQNFYNLLTTTESANADSRISPPTKKIIDIERELLSLIIGHPDYIDAVVEKIVPEDFQGETQRKMYSLIITIYKTQGTLSESLLLDILEDKQMISEISSLVKLDWHGYNIPVTVKDYIRKLLDFKRERIIEQLKAELKESEKSGNSELSRKLMEEISDIIKRPHDHK
jgi:DNA primase